MRARARMLRRDGSFEELRVLITVKTYPTPSSRYIETVCTAGIAGTGEFVRLYPVPFSLMDSGRQYNKYDWVRMRAKRKLSDPRPESYAPVTDTLAIDGHMDTDQQWRERRDCVLPLLAGSLEELKEAQRQTGRSLGLIKPARVDKFSIVPTRAEFTPRQLAKLGYGNDSCIFDPFARRDLARQICRRARRSAVSRSAIG